MLHRSIQVLWEAHQFVAEGHGYYETMDQFGLGPIPES